jgi:hypothetical protein
MWLDGNLYRMQCKAFAQSTLRHQFIDKYHFCSIPFCCPLSASYVKLLRQTRSVVLSWLLGAVLVAALFAEYQCYKQAHTHSPHSGVRYGSNGDLQQVFADDLGV